MTLSSGARPRLSPKALLRFDRKTDRHVLLYPEKGLVLNATGTEIVRLCTGEHTVDAIIEQLVAKYTDQPREVVTQEVMAFLSALQERALLLDEGTADTSKEPST